MNIKNYTKTACALLATFLASTPSFAMKPTKMPGFTSGMFMKMPKSLNEEAKLAKLDSYMQVICAKIFAPDNTNPMVNWARQHSRPRDVNRTIYQIWASGARRTEASIDSDPALGRDFYVLPESLRKIAVENSKFQTKKYINLATALLCNTPNVSKTESKTLYESRNRELRKKVDDLLHQGDCWYSFDQPGMGFWTEKVKKELIGNRIITLREMIDILSQTAERKDFFGNCIIGACIAYKKCEELGLSCDFAVRNGHYGVIVNSNGKKYIVNYPVGVLNIVANGAIHKNIIEEIDDIKYNVFEIIPLGGIMLI